MSDRTKPIARSPGAVSSAGLRRWGALLSAMAACLFASAGTAAASESLCADFCSPIESSQLDNYRAQGLDAPSAGNTKLGVILWDEYRRLRQPGDTSGIVGNAPAILNASISGTSTSLH
jgi:hypothetical protein